MEQIIYLNGDYLPLSEAKISVLDRGFLFGDGVYEVIPCYQGRFLGFNAHIERLQASLQAIQIELPYSTEQWHNLLFPLLNAQSNQYIYLQISRGYAPKRDHVFPAFVQPTVFAMANLIAPFLEREQGIKAVTLEDNRWALCHIKATSLLANVLLKQQAAEQNAAEAILIREGYVTEGSASNVFAVVDGVLLTAPKGTHILAGITREIVLQLARAHQIPVSETAISVAQLAQATEVWVTSSTREIVPIIEINGQKVADGKAGSVWQILNGLYQSYKLSAS